MQVRDTEENMFNAQYVDSEVSVFEIIEEDQFIVRFIANSAVDEENILTDINHLEYND